MLVGHSGAPDRVVQGIYGFHIPFFFILSGYLYDRNKWNNLGAKTLIKRRWKAYVIPYFVLSLFNLFINIPVEFFKGIRGKELLISTLKHIFWIFYSFGNAVRTPNCTPLWFLLCVFLSSIYLYCLLKIKKVSLQLLMCVSASAVVYLFDKGNVIQLPWHIDAALPGMVFMYIGLWFREQEVLKKISNYFALVICLLVTGTYCIYTNASIDINTNRLNNIALMYAGAICVSFAVIIVVYRYIPKSRLLEFWGKNTIIFMAFNYAINSYSWAIWGRMPFIQSVPYYWWIKTIVNIIILHIICIIWNKVKSQHPEIAIF